MDEYISREAVINITAETGAWETQNRVRELPSADVQPVVRCKDCIERPHCQTHSDDFYCAFGERSDSND